MMVLSGEMMTRAISLLTVTGALLSGCARETVAHGQDERSANKIIGLLYATAAIDADAIIREKSNPPAFDVSVSQTDHQRALAILEKYNLPADKKDDTCGLLIRSTELIPTPERQLAKTTCGISGDITNKLRAIDGVVEASVLLSIPAKTIELDLTVERPRPRASVIVTFLPNGDKEPPISQNEVASFAAAAVPELQLKDVFVRMIPATNEWAVQPGATTCVKTEIFGVAICAEDRSRLASLVLTAICVSGVFAALMLFAVLRALRYRRELTRLTTAASARA